MTDSVWVLMHWDGADDGTPSRVRGVYVTEAYARAMLPARNADYDTFVTVQVGVNANGGPAWEERPDRLAGTLHDEFCCTVSEWPLYRG